jgi:hypothetical protein
MVLLSEAEFDELIHPRRFFGSQHSLKRTLLVIGRPLRVTATAAIVPGEHTSRSRHNVQCSS